MSKYYLEAALDKLAIRGIRSFDDKRVEVIQFFSPVTVIVGQNGSGKTTIIECLKYATTGEQPPNTRGGAFIHDPKMAAEKEVKAQVKLRFRAANGNPMLVLRNLSVTLKKGAGMAMKTLESVLSALPKDGDVDGKRHNISSRCAEMDVEIPALLGVSKAVLDNVIFCHQEDSYWPLAEASVLKKKFDEIFEASKYTKALDAIKNLRKERLAELKVDKERLEGALREKNHADKLKSRIEDLNATVAGKEAEYQELNERVAALEVQNKEFYERATHFRDIFLHYETAQNRKNQLEMDLRDISESLELLEGTDIELEDRRRGFEHHMQTQKATRDRKAVDLREEEERLDDMRRQLGEEQKREGQLLAEEQTHHKSVARRDNLVRDVSKKYGLKGFDQGALDKNQWADFRSRINDLQHRRATDLETAQAEGHARNGEFMLQIQNLQADIATLRAERDTLNASIYRRQQAIKDADLRLDNIHAKSSELKGVSSDIEQKSKRIEALREEIRSNDYEAKLEEKSNALRSLETQRERLNNEMTLSNQQMESRAALSLRKDEAQKLDSEIKSILDTLSTRYQKVMGRKPHVDDIDRDLERAILQKEKEAKDLEGETTAANRKLAQVEGNIANLKARQKQMEEEVKTLEKKLNSARGDYASISLALADTQDQMSLCQEEIAKNTDSGRFYQEILKNGRAKKVCISCNRHIKDDEMAAFEKHVSNLLKKDTSAKLNDLQEELAIWQADFTRLQQALPMELNCTKLKQNDIPDLIQEQFKLEGSLEDATTEAASLSDKLEEVRSTLKTLQALKQQAGTISTLSQKKNTAAQYARNLEETLRAGNVTMSLEEIQAELSSLQAKQSSLHMSQSELHQVQLRETQLQNEVKETERLEKESRDNQEGIKSDRLRIKDVEARLLQANEPVEAVKAEQRTFDASHQVRVSGLQQAAQEINLEVEKLDAAMNNAEEYIKEQGPRKLKRCQESLADLQDAIQRSLEDIEKMRKDIAALADELASSSTTLSTLKDNLRLRKIRRDIAAANEEMSSLNLEEASNARQRFDEKYGRAKEAEEEAKRQCQHLLGELSSLRNQLKGLEMDAKEYRGATKKYTDQLIKTKMSDMVNNDLEKYAKALDRRVHDIDGIKIISEGEGATGRRTYNYRVGAAVNLVGSVLTSETGRHGERPSRNGYAWEMLSRFGANCGILALDEPTNALDVDNIEALAQSLVEYVPPLP
ncbi:DNA repair protein rad50 [Serendipita sp. 399]|nr:DNA repair protein rad50 [Serendipita sp. 399]